MATVDKGPIDYDLHGLAGIRLLGAAPADARAVDRQLGPIRAPLRRDPDLVVRFVDRLDVGGPVRLLGVGDAGFTGDAFLVLRSRHKARARVRIALADLGRGGEIVCERGLPEVPLLIAALNLTVLARGALPLHASAFLHDGRGVVVTGWSRGGKTESLLAFMAHGARFVGDEWVYVEADGATVHGIPEPLRLWDWQLRQLPTLRARVGRVDRARLAALRGAVAATGGRRARRVRVAMAEQLHVDIAPQLLFAPADIALSAPFDRLFLVGSWEDAHTAARPVDPGEVAARMAASLQRERAPLTRAYQQFRFAFPERRNALLESAPDRERELLAQVFDGKAAHAVEHPYPVDLERLFDVMRPLC
jgi:hypothetical protein